MASLPPSLRKTLAYFDKYDYPLTLEEIRFWQERVTPFASPRAKGVTLSSRKGKYYFLPGRSHLIALRCQREQFSKQKWIIARQVGESLKRFPTIAAIFVTGALAMNNCPADDDIDLMIVTHPNTLWLTRPFVDLYLYLKSLRRFPGQTSAPNKICPNLWLDTRHLRVTPWVASDAQGVTLFDRNVYFAHEILQAKVLWDRVNVHAQFLRANSWAKNYLPVAYEEIQRVTPFAASDAKGVTLSILFWPLNLIFFILQFIYMLPKMTSERISLHSAFFHPAK